MVMQSYAVGLFPCGLAKLLIYCNKSFASLRGKISFFKALKRSLMRNYFRATYFAFLYPLVIPTTEG